MERRWRTAYRHAAILESHTSKAEARADDAIEEHVGPEGADPNVDSVIGGAGVSMQKNVCQEQLTFRGANQC